MPTPDVILLILGAVLVIKALVVLLLPKVAQRISRILLPILDRGYIVWSVLMVIIGGGIFILGMQDQPLKIWLLMGFASVALGVGLLGFRPHLYRLLVESLVVRRSEFVLRVEGLIVLCLGLLFIAAKFLAPAANGGMP